MKKINLKEFKSSEIEVKKLLEVKGGSSCVTGSPSCVTNVADKDGIHVVVMVCSVKFFKLSIDFKLLNFWRVYFNIKKNDYNIFK